MKSLKLADAVPARDNPRGGQDMSYGLLPRILGYHLRRTQVAIFQHFTRTVTSKEDITPGLFGMLQVIAANPGLGQSRLAETMEVDRSTIVKVVDRLEDRGLIMREPSATDKRAAAHGSARAATRRRVHQDPVGRRAAHSGSPAGEALQLAARYGLSWRTAKLRGAQRSPGRISMTEVKTSRRLTQRLWTLTEVKDGAAGGR